MKYSHVSGLPSDFNTPDHWALGFCVSQLLASVRDHRYEEAIERLFSGEGHISDDGWEMCRARERSFAADIEVSPEEGDHFLIWTDPDDYGFEPNCRLYAEAEFKAVFPQVCFQCNKQAGRPDHPALFSALEKYCA